MESPPHETQNADRRPKGFRNKTDSGYRETRGPITELFFISVIRAGHLGKPKKLTKSQIMSLIRINIYSRSDCGKKKR